ncbi:MAG TPA: ABC transporter permease [Armatimonadota bacterium]|nr:ABC transporter permease [Armatimonadota bacterium]
MTDKQSLTPSPVSSDAESGVRSRLAGFWLKYGNWGALALVFLLASIFSPRDLSTGQNVFLKPDNLIDILRQISEGGILAVGMTLVVLLAGIDLSVGSVLALGATLSAVLLLNHHWPAWAVFIVVLMTGAAAGFLNGAVSVWGRVQPFVVTLAAMTIFRGAARLLTDGNALPLESFGHGPGQVDPVFGILAERVDGIIPVPVIILLVVVAVCHIWMSRTAIGRHVYAIGGNRKAAVLSGLPVRRVIIIMYCVCSLLACLAGMIHAAQFQQASPASDGQGYELTAIAATVIGGASLFGGQGTVVGALAGALIMGIIDNFLGIHNVTEHWRLVIQGLIILAAVLLQRGRDEE